MTFPWYLCLALSGYDDGMEALPLVEATFLEAISWDRSSYSFILLGEKAFQPKNPFYVRKPFTSWLQVFYESNLSTTQQQQQHWHFSLKAPLQHLHSFHKIMHKLILCPFKVQSLFSITKSKIQTLDRDFYHKFM